jgi:AcrR family transcriptional regulator
VKAPDASKGAPKARRAALSLTAVTPRLRHPGSVLGTRANRTIATILDATRQIFLVRGYAGTTIDEIARVAGLSRGSFYTYFPSKRDVLLTLGADSLSAGKEVIKSLGKLGDDWQLDALEEWVGEYFEVLEEHGSFAIAWTQAAHEDEEIRRAGMQGHLQLCRRMGLALAALGSKSVDDPTSLGLATYAMLERGWSYSKLYEGALDPVDLRRMIARMLAGATEAL